MKEERSREERKELTLRLGPYSPLLWMCVKN